VILADVEGVERLPAILDACVERGAMPVGKAAAWVRMAGQIYSDPSKARDEAIRSASLAAMTMMLAAEARGLVSGALTGFDPAQVSDSFGIEDRFLPVMLLAVGYPAGAAGVQMPRMDVADVLAIDRWHDGPGED
jgi:nitroreductase